MDVKETFKDIKWDRLGIILAIIAFGLLLYFAGRASVCSFDYNLVENVKACTLGVLPGRGPLAP